MDAATWARHVTDERAIARYHALISDAELPSGCRPWVGALSAQGSGRFWLPGNRVVVAHRFGFALRFGVAALLAGAHVAHTCDEASCQTAEHWASTSARQNTQDWASRRATIGNPLRDRRGALGRARALRAAALASRDLDVAARQGLPEVDLYQDPLPI